MSVADPPFVYLGLFINDVITEGEGGYDTPKIDDVIYDQPLKDKHMKRRK